MAIIRLEQLNKVYKSGKNTVQAVNDLSLEIEAGQIYGFLGANGAGKTTTIRMLLNLVYPTSGQVYLFDTPISEAKSILREKVGALVEEATFYPFMTAYDNLQLLARMSGNDDKQDIQQVLEQVGLSTFENRKTKTYSTGMKQRLGVAATLLHNPDLLILDESSSGLDPKGIQEMRDMLKNLVQNEGKTVFLSSHLLHEIEQMCNRVAIINRGRLVQEGNVSDLLGDKALIHIRATPINAAHDILSEHFTVQIRDNMLVVNANRDDIPNIINELVSHDIAIYEVSPKGRSLEDFFLEVTNA